MINSEWLYIKTVAINKPRTMKTIRPSGPVGCPAHEELLRRNLKSINQTGVQNVSQAPVYSMKSLFQEQVYFLEQTHVIRSPIGKASTVFCALCFHRQIKRQSCTQKQMEQNYKVNNGFPSKMMYSGCIHYERLPLTIITHGPLTAEQWSVCES